MPHAASLAHDPILPHVEPVIPDRRRIVEEILALPVIADWPELVAVIAPAGFETQPVSPWACWHLPRLACAAVGGPEAHAIPGMAAVVCLLQSIHLVDDMLDDEPDGWHERLGVGATANLALALQAAAAQLIERAPISADRRVLAHAAVARAAVATARGQALDSQPPAVFDEAAYWRVVDAKTPPLFTVALELGVLLAGADEQQARTVGRLGQSIGRLIQVSDDLKDALESPQSPDWKACWNNLAILFAYLVDHPERARFHQLLEELERPEALDEARAIVIRSGALSYCLYQMGESYRAGIEQISTMSLADRAPLDDLFQSLTRSVRGLFAGHGLAVPDVFISER